MVVHTTENTTENQSIDRSPNWGFSVIYFFSSQQQRRKHHKALINKQLPNMKTSFRHVNAFNESPTKDFNEEFFLLQNVQTNMMAFHNRRRRRRRRHLIRHKRRTIDSIIRELGDHYFRRAYRMTKKDFFKLVAILRPSLVNKNTANKQVKKRAPNGPISPETRLSIALRYFAGGKAYDIALVHGVSHSSVFERCIWPVVEAINHCTDFDINFPEDHDEQVKIAGEFKAKSAPGFDVCVGAIDGILIWTEQPRKKDSDAMKCGAKRFFCGRKHKFGFNMQAICDAKGNFLQVWIKNPGSSSDYICYVRSKFYDKLLTPGFLAEGLALFGDNAYVASTFMVVPYKGARKGPKDDFNFYQSQLRINIECAFGKLVARWSILRSALPAAMGCRKQIALVLALCKLHNFCSSCELPKPIPSVQVGIIGSGGVELGGSDLTPAELLGGGQHFDDVADEEIRRTANADTRTRLRKIVENEGLKRPIANKIV
jgi:hypothetical protein